MRRSKWSVTKPAAVGALLGIALGCATGEPASDGDYSAATGLADTFDAAPSTLSEISPADLKAHVAALTAPAMEGRMTGSRGEERAARYIEAAMKGLGLVPAGDETEGGAAFSHAFEFISGIDLGPNNQLAISHASASGESKSHSFRVGEEWQPLAFSQSDPIEETEIVFAGYGVVAPAENGGPAVNDYAQIDVQERWVLVFRGMPAEIEGDTRQRLQRYVSLRHKAMVARDHGARGILFLSGPLSSIREQLVPLRFDASLAGTRIGAFTVTDSAAETFLKAAQEAPAWSLNALQKETNQRFIAAQNGEPPHPHARAASPVSPSSPFPPISIRGRIDLRTARSTGHNVLGRLQVGAAPSAQTVMLGAHFDHLGFGNTTGSLATTPEIGQMHGGADDNASGVAALLEVAEALASARNAGEDIGRRDFVFAAWSGEELGLLGSNAWTRANINPHSRERGPVAYLNFDMVGRLREELILQGLGSSPVWSDLVAAAAEDSFLKLALQQDAYLPTDVTSFYTQGVPVLAAFTGVHGEYHTPRDRLELLNLEGTAQIARLVRDIAEELSRAEAPPAYAAQKRPAAEQTRSGFRVFLGTIPDYAQTDLVGVRLSGVAPDGPAEKAGIQSGDIIVRADGRTIENLYDYTYALQALQAGKSAEIIVERSGDRLSFEVVPASRD
ncbi:MAG: M20/M25/M40 family metallo-hydrolase [Myxococcota bacterium]